MTHRHSGGTRAALGVALIVALAGCHSGGHLVGNLAPHVDITGSPVEGDSVNYVVDFHWNAWDDDGSITRSEYAVDIPSSFTPAQIADPATPGIAWTSTTGTHAELRFSVAGGPVPPPEEAGYRSERASAPHTFFVRSYDNAETPSAVAERSFNAWTALPRTTITAPAQLAAGHLAGAGARITLRWEVEDPDARDAGAPSTHTEYKMIPVARPAGILDPNLAVNLHPGPDVRWIPVSPDSHEVTLLLPPRGAYLLALRSIDEADGVESRFELGRNAALLELDPAGCPFDGNRPVLMVYDTLLGGNIFPRDGQVVDYSILPGQCLRWDLWGDAREFQGHVTALRWCVDAAEDALGAGDGPACVPWGSRMRTPEICFATPGVHTVSFGLRASSALCGEAATVGTLRLTVETRYFDRDVLYVDDSSDSWHDGEYDRRILGALRAAGYQTIDSYDVFDAGDVATYIRPLTFERLIRYRVVFWVVRGARRGTSYQDSALRQAAVCAGDQALRRYVAAGGALWLSGEGVFDALRETGAAGPTPAGGPLPFSAGFGAACGSFEADVLHLEGSDIRNALADPPSNNLRRAVPTARARAEGVPTLEADSTGATPWPGGPTYWVTGYDAMFRPTFVSDGSLDTLYTAGTVGLASPFNGKPVAWRVTDPGPEPRRGPIIVTGFSFQQIRVGTPSRVANGVTVPGTGLAGLAEVMAAWLRSHDVTRSSGALPWAGRGRSVRARYEVGPVVDHAARGGKG